MVPPTEHNSLLIHFRIPYNRTKIKTKFFISLLKIVIPDQIIGVRGKKTGTYDGNPALFIHIISPLAAPSWVTPEVTLRPNNKKGYSNYCCNLLFLNGAGNGIRILIKGLKSI